MKTNTVINAANHRLEHEPVPADQSLGGKPETGAAALGEVGGLEVGVWEVTPGVVTDVGADDVFVVLSGSATVKFDDGTPAL